tara:strand:+ start:1713 stop:1898 length:186 start_codon:yes stop_codon:yes gene_type:complete
MKTYAVREAGSGYKVVWFFEGSLYGTEYDVENGYFNNLNDAENKAQELEFEEMMNMGGKGK